MVSCPAGVCPDESLSRRAEMEQAWAELEARYPQPDTSGLAFSLDDGSWQGPGGLWLNPSENADVTDHHRRARTHGEDVVRPALVDIETQDDSRKLVGLDYWIKSLDRLREKVASNLQLPGEPTFRAINAVQDTIRFTFAYCHLRYAQGVEDDMQRLREASFERLTFRNSWVDEEYKGVNSTWWIDESGFKFEVQFHTPESYEAKTLTHPAYERLRVAGPSNERAYEAERRALREYQRWVSTLVSVPADVYQVGVQEASADA